MNLFESYIKGTFESEISQMDMKQLTKEYKEHGFRNPSKNREKLLEQFKKCMAAQMNKGKAFERCGEKW